MDKLNLLLKWVQNLTNYDTIVDDTKEKNIGIKTLYDSEMNVLLDKKEAVKIIREVTGYNYIHTPNCSSCFMSAVTEMKNKIEELLNLEQTKISESEKIKLKEDFERSLDDSAEKLKDFFNEKKDNRGLDTSGDKTKDVGITPGRKVKNDNTRNSKKK
jgi:Fe-S cluster biogenesis protein NfuA